MRISTEDASPGFTSSLSSSWVMPRADSLESPSRRRSNRVRVSLIRSGRLIWTTNLQTGIDGRRVVGTFIWEKLPWSTLTGAHRIARRECERSKEA